ncbi:hypothetical protein L596_021751 [Steinernema carpocapsae]|uniref:Uncharacterized protein n=1 Tax=Steinernema carpocapsae TaxID=34508 RepID=A0A4U5MK09_STECR|nr:hypothetical protein L596_021751 [Steinernema carpocapsae]
MLPDLRFPNESQEIAALRAEYSGELQAVYNDQVAADERQQHTSQVQAIQAAPQNSAALQRTPTKRHTSPSDPLSPRRLPGMRQSQKADVFGPSPSSKFGESLPWISKETPKRQTGKSAGFTAEQKKARKAEQTRESRMRKKGKDP